MVLPGCDTCWWREAGASWLGSTCPEEVIGEKRVRRSDGAVGVTHVVPMSAQGFFKPRYRWKARCCRQPFVQENK